MTTSSIRPGYTPSFQKADAPANPAPTPEPPRKEFDEDQMTWGQAGRGLVGAVIGAGIEAVGNTASSLVRLPGAVGHAYKALWNTEMFGPVLKTTIGAALIPVTVALPVLTAIGSAGVGMFVGFEAAAKDGLGAAATKTADHVKWFHEKIAGTGLNEALDEIGSHKLGEGEKPYEIKLIEGAKGLAGGAVAGVVDGVGVGAITLVNTPRGLVKAGKEIWKSDASLPTKTVASVLLPAAAVLATPLGLVGGALYGAVIGTKDGYTEGFGKAVNHSVDTVKQVHKYVDKALDEI